MLCLVNSMQLVVCHTGFFLAQLATYGLSMRAKDEKFALALFKGRITLTSSQTNSVFAQEDCV